MLTLKLQTEILAKMLAGRPVPPVDETFFDEPWRSCYRVIENANGNALQALREMLETHPQGEDILKAILSADVEGGTPDGVRLSDLAKTVKPLSWLWPGWIPRSMVTILGAVPGAGKSFFVLELARRIIHGETWPDGAPIPDDARGGPVLFVDGELALPILVERARNWGLDMDRILIMEPETLGSIIDLSTSRDQERMVEIVFHYRPSLIVVDSLSSVTSKSENSVEDVRDLFAFLSEVAFRYETGLVLVHHLRKRTAGTLSLDLVDMHDLRGSGHITAIPRVVIGLSVIHAGLNGRGDNIEGPRRIEVIKSNIGRKPKPLGFEFRPLHPRGVWLHFGDAPEPPKEPSKVDECAEWIVDVLKERGEMPVKELEQLAKEEGFSRATFYRARRKLHGVVVNTKGRQANGNCWKLADEEKETDEIPF